MSSFDVFVNGIQPNKIAETQRVINDFSERLRVTIQKAEKIIKRPNTRISKSTTKEQAEKLQKTLQEIGVVCIYKPSVETSGLSLEPIEEKGEGALTHCPSCNQKFVGDSKAPPEKCEGCGVYIKKYLELHTDENKIEKERIREQLLRKNSIRLAQEKKIKEAQVEEIRQKLLEQAVLKENPSLKRRDKKSKKTNMLVVSSVVIATAAYASYAFWGTEENISTDMANESNNIVAEQSSQQSDELATEIPQSSANVAGLSLPTGGSSQQAMQDTHQKASKVLNAFGLNADAFANASSGGAGTQGGLMTTLSHSQKVSAKGKKLIGVLTPLLLSLGGSEQEWDQFLTTKVEQSIIKGSFLSANKIISYLTNTEKFITFSGLLLNAANKPELAIEINSNIERRIKRSPLELKAQYLSQSAEHQNETGAANLLFNRAISSLHVISDPHKKLIATLKIAVSFFKIGDVSSANLYFKHINLLLPEINTHENQIDSRVAISHAFQEVGQTTIALNWLKSTDGFVKDSNELGFRDMVNGYAYLNKANKVLQLVKLAPSTITQDELLYGAANVSLVTGLNNNAINYVNLMQNSTNKALSFTLLASYLKNNSTYLISSENLLKNIDGIANKAVISSRIAQQYARLGSTKKVNELFKLTENLINRLPASTERDKLLKIVIVNYAQPLEHKSLASLVSYIQAPNVKSEIDKKISQLTEVSALL